MLICGLYHMYSHVTYEISWHLFFSLPLELFWLTGVNSVGPTALQSLLASLTPESAKTPSKTHRKICETSRNIKKNSPESCLDLGKEVSKLLASPISFHDWRHCKLLNNPQVHCSLTLCWGYGILNFSTLHCETGVTPENSCEKALIIRQQQYIRTSATPILSSTSCKSSCKSCWTKLCASHCLDQVCLGPTNS